MKLYRNGIVYTGTNITDSFVVDGNHFAEYSENQDYDEIIDLNGNFVCAGFNDSHMHILNYGNVLSQANLTKATSSLSEMLEYLKTYILDHNQNPDSVIRGRGWNHDYFQDENRFPTRYDLDQVSTTHPIIITRCCGHVCVVNSKALEMITLPDNLTMSDGQIDVDENGGVLGIFREAAIDYVSTVFEKITKEEIKDYLLTAGHGLNQYGITSVQSDDLKVFDIDYKVVLEAFHEIEDQLTVRVNEQSQLTKEELEEFFELGYTTNVGTEKFKIGPLKMLGDGSLGAGTAYMKEPYSDSKDIRGIPIYTLEQFKEMFELAHTHNMQIAVHAIGDATFENLLNAYEYILTKYPKDDHRHGIIHCQITSYEQLERFAKMKLHAYIQSIFLDYDIHIVEKRVGERAKESYQFKHYLNLGSTLSNGSDCPVEWPNVLRGIQCAVTRKTISGMGPYLIEEACTIQEAIDSFTRGSAFASFEENKKGLIQPGYLADFTIIDTNLFEADPNKLVEANILSTYLNGICVYSK